MPLACNRILLKYNKEITPFKNIKLGLTLTFQFVIFIDNSMICSDIWHKYHDWYFESDVISRAVRRETIWVEYMPNITYKSCYYWFILTTRKSFVIFTCRNFKLSWNTTARSQSNCRNFSCLGINREINATAARYKITYFKCFMLRHVTALRLEGYLNFCIILTIAILVTKRSRYVCHDVLIFLANPRDTLE